jgi:4-oxalocrotonate tautomerase
MFRAVALAVAPSRFGRPLMPIIRVEMVAGRTVEQKRELVEVLTRETARIVGSSASSIFVVIDDVNKENWGAGGKLLSDSHPD